MVKLRYFRIGLISIGQEFTLDEVETLIDAAVKTDKFFDEEFDYLATLTNGEFKKEEIRQMYVTFEKLDRELTEEFTVRIGSPDITMGFLMLEKSLKLFEKEWQRGDSFIKIPFGRQIRPNAVVHELSHIVHASFCEECGVNYGLKDYFKRLDNDLRQLNIEDQEELRRRFGEAYKQDKIDAEIFSYMVERILMNEFNTPPSDFCLNF